MIRLTIDSKTIEAKEGITILDAAEKEGIHIPNLCYLKGMKGIGACRLCLVEIGGLKSPMTACTTKVKEGMSIRTSTPEIEETRRFIIDLILSMHPMDCMTCTKAGICRLQEYAYQYNLKETNYTRKRWNFPVDNQNPFIKRDPDYCVLCGRCVRVCKEQGTKILDFMGRGVGSKVTTAGDKPLQDTSCTFCGSCVDVCPVNALTEAGRTSKGREWELKKTDSTCVFCGCACPITVSSQGNSIVKITSAYKVYEPTSYTCAYGRYGFDYITSKDRILNPMVRRGGQLHEATWEEAVDVLAAALSSSGKDTAFYINGGLLTEDALTLSSFAKEILKTDLLYSTSNLYWDPNTAPLGATNISDADLLVLVNLSPDQGSFALPALDAILRRLSNSGIPLITLGETSLSDIGTVNISGDAVEGLRSLTAYLCREGLCKDKELIMDSKNAPISEDVERAGKLFAASKNPLIMSPASLYECSCALASIKGSVIPVSFESNAVGIALAGIEGSVTNPSAFGKDQKVKALYLIGDTNITSRHDISFLAVHQSHLTELARAADVVLPLTTPYESTGTVIKTNLHTAAVNRAVEPYGTSMMPREALKLIADKMGQTFNEITQTEAKELIKQAATPQKSAFCKKEGLSEDPSMIFKSVNQSMLASDRLCWLHENRKRSAGRS